MCHNLKRVGTSSVLPYCAALVLFGASVCQTGAAGDLEVQGCRVDGLRKRPQRPFRQGLVGGLRTPGNLSSIT